jgi:hypothetical protein
LTEIRILVPAFNGAFSSVMLFNFIIDSIVELNLDAISRRESFNSIS